MNVLEFANTVGLLMLRLHYQRLKRIYGEGFEETLAYEFSVAIELDIEAIITTIKLPYLSGIIKSGN